MFFLFCILIWWQKQTGWCICVVKHSNENGWTDSSAKASGQDMKNRSRKSADSEEEEEGGRTAAVCDVCVSITFTHDTLREFSGVKVLQLGVWKLLRSIIGSSSDQLLERAYSDRNTCLKIALLHYKKDIWSMNKNKILEHEYWCRTTVHIIRLPLCTADFDPHAEGWTA